MIARKSKKEYFLDESILIGVPKDAARLLLKDGGVFLCRLLSTKKFVDFCKKRDVSVSAQRLLNLEKLGLFRPIFRLRMPEQERAPLIIPLTDPEWFDRGWAIDTTLSESHWTPQGDEQSEAYFSGFQIASLQFVLNMLTTAVQLEEFIFDDEFNEAEWAYSREKAF